MTGKNEQFVSVLFKPSEYFRNNKCSDFAPQYCETEQIQNAHGKYKY